MFLFLALCNQQPLPAHSKHTSLPYTHAHGHAHPLHFLSHHDPRMLPPGNASLPVPTMQLMMSHHDVIMKQYNKAVAERLAKIVEDRASAGRSFHFTPDKILSIDLPIYIVCISIF